MLEHQTAGKGRHGKTWHSPESGNIYLSIKYQARSTVPALSLIVGLLVAEALDEASGQKINAALKWPNDVLLKNKKICGILQEVVEYNNDKFLKLEIYDTDPSPAISNIKRLNNKDYGMYQLQGITSHLLPHQIFIKCFLRPDL